MRDPKQGLPEPLLDSLNPALHNRLRDLRTRVSTQEA